MVNYACAFSQSESGKYFERIIRSFIWIWKGTPPLELTCITFKTWKRKETSFP